MKLGLKPRSGWLQTIYHIVPIEENIFPSYHRGAHGRYQDNEFTVIRWNSQQKKGRRQDLKPGLCVSQASWHHVSCQPSINLLRTKNDFSFPRPNQTFMPQPPENRNKAEAAFLELGRAEQDLPPSEPEGKPPRQLLQPCLCGVTTTGTPEG